MTGRDSDKIVLRVPDGMRDRIKQFAADNGRSMNAEIVATLEEAYPHPEMHEEEFGAAMIDLLKAMTPRERKRIAAAMTEALADEGYPIEVVVKDR